MPTQNLAAAVTDITGGTTLDFGFSPSDIFVQAAGIVKQLGPYALLGLSIVFVSAIIGLIWVAARPRGRGAKG